MADNEPDGFDQEQYRGEVVRRWGQGSWDRWQRWWRTLAPADAERFRAEWAAIGGGYAKALAEGRKPTTRPAQAVARRHVALLAGIPAAQDAQGGPDRAYLLRLARLYADDSRYVAFTGSSDPGIGAFMRDALLHFLGERDRGG